MIAIVKYNAGNIRSVINALSRFNIDSVVTDDPTILLKAEKVIFPGVGEAKTAMQYLKKKGLDEIIKNLKQPFLGICLGLQLMCKHSEEGDTEGLNIFNHNVRKFPSTGKVPHMGWNNFTSIKSNLFNNILTDDDVYFVHSYYAEKGENTIAETDYLLPFSCALQKDNFYAVQFHPEKSGNIGKNILKNFLDI